MSDSGCALDASGALKPAEHMEWYNDADDDEPMNFVSTTAPRHLTASTSTSSLSQGNLDGFVRLQSSGKVAAHFVASARRSGRAPKPSAKIREAANAPSIPAKRPPPTTATSARKRPSVDTEPDLSSDLFEDEGVDDDEMPELQENSDDEDEDEEAREEYERNKAMANTDRDVSHYFINSQTHI